MGQYGFCGDLWIAIMEGGRIFTSPALGLPALKVPEVTIAFAAKLTWESEFGQTYQIQQSSDNIHWENVGGTFLGDGKLQGWTSDTDAARRFFRIQAR